MSTIVEQVKDESRRKELRVHDDEEDYLDEGLAFTYFFGHWCFVQSHYSFAKYNMEHTDALRKRSRVGM